MNEIKELIQANYNKNNAIIIILNLCLFELLDNQVIAPDDMKERAESRIELCDTLKSIISSLELEQKSYNVTH